VAGHADLIAAIRTDVTGLNAVRRDIVALSEDNARQQAVADRMGGRLERIETRLTLSEAV